jgi:hypothetical protein
MLYYFINENKSGSLPKYYDLETGTILHYETSSLYLYGSKTVPSDLTAESLIRKKSDEIEPITTNVDINAYLFHNFKR